MLAKLDAWTTSTERQPYNRLNTSGNINTDKGHFEHSTETKIFFSDLNFLPLLSFFRFMTSFISDENCCCCCCCCCYSCRAQHLRSKKWRYLFSEREFDPVMLHLFGMKRFAALIAELWKVGYVALVAALRAPGLTNYQQWRVVWKTFH